MIKPTGSAQTLWELAQLTTAAKVVYQAVPVRGPRNLGTLPRWQD
jgi:hypothetical protein